MSSFLHYYYGRAGTILLTVYDIYIYIYAGRVCTARVYILYVRHQNDGTKKKRGFHTRRSIDTTLLLITPQCVHTYNLVSVRIPVI